MTLHIDIIDMSKPIDLDLGSVMPCGNDCGATYRNAGRLHVPLMQLNAQLDGWGLIWEEGNAYLACPDCATHFSKRDELLDRKKHWKKS